MFGLRTRIAPPTYRGRSHQKILDSHEKEKKDKYLESWEHQRKSFTPLVFTIDGVRGTEAIAASKRLARILSGKWNKTYSKVCGYVNSPLSIALVRMSSRCICGSRNPIRRIHHPAWECGAGLALSYDTLSLSLEREREIESIERGAEVRTVGTLRTYNHNYYSY